MGCCGQNRQAWHTPPKRLRTSDAARTAAVERGIAMRYLGPTSIVVAGPVTGTAYVFAAAGEPLPVDGRDADGLLALGDFAMAAEA